MEVTDSWEFTFLWQFVTSFVFLLVSSSTVYFPTLDYIIVEPYLL